ncbi:MAG TPA: PAS domain-containing protein, partial [Terricaulis sp.]|nr:PAS domain-containing protein [Terricaulis sp.]
TLYATHARLSAARAERALRLAHAQASHDARVGRLLLENEDGATALLDREGRILAASKRVRARIGAVEAAGLKFENVTPLERAHWREAFARALQGEHVVCEDEEVRLADGRHWINWDVRPWRDEDGEIAGVLTTARDVTSLVSARKVANGSHDLLRGALDAGKSVIWEVDYKAQTIAWYGNSAIYGEAFTFKQFQDNSTEIIHIDDREMLREYFLRIAAGEDESIEHRVVQNDGSITWAQVRARRVLGRSGGVRKFIVLSTDVTERKRREAAFIAAMHRAETTLKAKRALFGDIAPELDDIDHAQVGVAEMHERLDSLMEEMDARDVVLAETMASLRTAREAAEAASVSKSQFLASMSHELRTPL